MIQPTYMWGTCRARSGFELNGVSGWPSGSPTDHSQSHAATFGRSALWTRQNTITFVEGRAKTASTQAPAPSRGRNTEEANIVLSPRRRQGRRRRWQSRRACPVTEEASDIRGRLEGPCAVSAFSSWRTRLCLALALDRRIARHLTRCLPSLAFACCFVLACPLLAVT